MGNFLSAVFLSLFVASQTLAAVVPSGVPAQGYGGGTSLASATTPLPPVMYLDQGNLSKQVTLVAGTGSSTAGNYYRLIRMGTQTTNLENYQVPAGNSLYCPGFYFQNSAAANFSFLYGTAAVTNNDPGAPTGERVYGIHASINTPSTSNLFWWPIPMMFPAGSYPAIKISSSAVSMYVYLICQLKAD